MFIKCNFSGVRMYNTKNTHSKGQLTETTGLGGKFCSVCPSPLFGVGMVVEKLVCLNVTQKQPYVWCIIFQDILFDSTNHLVKKFVLHTNYPGHYNFNM